MAATSDEFIRPFIQSAQDDVLARALGDEFLAELVEQCENNSLTPANEKLLPKVQKAVAWFGYLAYLPFSIGNDGDNGLQEQGTEHTSPVRMSILDKRMRESEKNACNALEAVLQWLEAHPEEYDTYHNGSVAKSDRVLFIPSATVMSTFLPQIQGNYRLYSNLRPYIQLVERDIFLPRLGRPMYDHLKSRLEARTLTPDEAELLFNLRRAVAHAAWYAALPQLQFSVLGSGQLRVLSDFDGLYSSKIPDKQLVSNLIACAGTDAKKWQNALRAYLNKNIDKFEKYAQSVASQEPSTNKLPDNEPYKSIFRLK